ncbi:MAG TPA: hypothetical protein DC049_06635, partial [Spirochaetia bacterium]|nr:hypothetical protein [Spirochaetia bacterium]
MYLYDFFSCTINRLTGRMPFLKTLFQVSGIFFIIPLFICAQKAGGNAAGAERGKLRPPVLHATVNRVSGNGFIRRADNTKIKITAGIPVYKNDFIQTYKNSRVSIDLPGDISFEMIGESAVTASKIFNDQETATGIKMPYGEILVKVKKLQNTRLEIETPVILVGVRGTYFGVRSDDLKASVRVFEGAVTVHDSEKRSAAVLVPAGYSCEAKKGRGIGVLIPITGAPGSESSDLIP